MAKRRKKKSKLSFIIGLIVVILIALGAEGFDLSDGKDKNTNLPMTDEDAYVHFIDVGQGSSTLIQVGNKGILIDAGERDYGEYVVDYINSCGIDSLQYVVASHPHSDHIGGMCDVIEEYPIGEIIMPELSEINTPTTKVYENLLDSIIENDITVTASEVGAEFQMEGVSMEIFGPVEQMKDLNDMSVICKVFVNGTDFMILGDAEKPELSSVFETVNSDYTADVIAMGHHGSSTSIHEDFLNAVNADVAVVSCGKDNSYGHPHKEALEYVKENGMTLYRTDYEGDVVFRCTAEGYERVEK